MVFVPTLVFLRLVYIMVSLLVKHLRVIVVGYVYHPIKVFLILRVRPKGTSD